MAQFEQNCGPIIKKINKLRKESSNKDVHDLCDILEWLIDEIDSHRHTVEIGGELFPKTTSKPE